MEIERDRKWTRKAEGLRTIATTNNHQSTLSGTPSLLLWKTWWWGIPGHRTPEQGLSPLWHPPLPAGLQNPLLSAAQQPLHTQEPGRCSGHTTAHLQGVNKEISREPMELFSICGLNNHTPAHVSLFHLSCQFNCILLPGFSACANSALCLMSAKQIASNVKSIFAVIIHFTFAVSAFVAVKSNGPVKFWSFRDKPELTRQVKGAVASAYSVDKASLYHDSQYQEHRWTSAKYTST